MLFRLELFMISDGFDGKILFVIIKVWIEIGVVVLQGRLPFFLEVIYF